jgi:hypothetical protein
MEKIEVRINIIIAIVSKEFNEDKEAYAFILETIRKFKNITRIEIQRDTYNKNGLLIQSNIKYYY